MCLVKHLEMTHSKSINSDIGHCFSLGLGGVGDSKFCE